MRNITKSGAFVLAAALAAGPVLAQTTTTAGTAPGVPTSTSPPVNAPTSVPVTHNGGTVHNANAMPSDRSLALTDDAEARASKVIGSAVYNDHDEKVGTVDDLVIGHDKVLTAVISVGGFLGAGSKLVAVPYNSLKLGDSKAGSDHRLVMPGATKQSLKSMADYHFSAAHHDSGVHRS